MRNDGAMNTTADQRSRQGLQRVTIPSCRSPTAPRAGPAPTVRAQGLPCNPARRSSDDARRGLAACSRQARSGRRSRTCPIQEVRRAAQRTRLQESALSWQHGGSGPDVAATETPRHGPFGGGPVFGAAIGSPDAAPLADAYSAANSAPPCSTRSSSFGVLRAMPVSNVSTPGVSGRSYFASFTSMSCTTSAIADQRGVVLEAEPVQQRLERAPVAFVRELALEHVEAELTGHGPVGLRTDEAEPRVRVDESTDQPGARHPVDEHAFARDPGSRPILPAIDARGCDRLPNVRRSQLHLDGVERLVGRRSPRRLEEVDGRHRGEPFPQSADLILAAPRRGVATPCPRCGLKRASGSGDLLVVGIARCAEGIAELVIGQAVDERRTADRRVAAAVDDLPANPLEILHRLIAVREHIHGVLHRNRSHPLQAPPDLDAEVVRLRRNLMDEKHPASGVRSSSLAHCRATDVTLGIRDVTEVDGCPSGDGFRSGM